VLGAFSNSKTFHEGATMAAKYFSIIIEIEIDDEDGLIDFPTVEELEKETKRFVKDRFAAEAVEIEAAEGTLHDEFDTEFSD
jgi:hypothetical protein